VRYMDTAGARRARLGLTVQTTQLSQPQSLRSAIVGDQEPKHTHRNAKGGGHQVRRPLLRHRSRTTCP
jgi:hypothetical protein